MNSDNIEESLQEPDLPQNMAIPQNYNHVQQLVAAQKRNVIAHQVSD